MDISMVISMVISVYISMLYPFPFRGKRPLKTGILRGGTPPTKALRKGGLGIAQSKHAQQREPTIGPLAQVLSRLVDSLQVLPLVLLRQPWLRGAALPNGLR